MSSDKLKLYEAHGSPNSRRVRIFLAEKGISASLVRVDLGAKEQFSNAYMQTLRIVSIALALFVSTTFADAFSFDRPMRHGQHCKSEAPPEASRCAHCRGKLWTRQHGRDPFFDK